MEALRTEGARSPPGCEIGGRNTHLPGISAGRTRLSRCSGRLRIDGLDVTWRYVFRCEGASFRPDISRPASPTVEERIQPAGECAQSDSDAHVFVVQSVPVAAPDSAGREFGGRARCTAERSHCCRPGCRCTGNGADRCSRCTSPSMPPSQMPCSPTRRVSRSTCPPRTCSTTESSAIAWHGCAWTPSATRSAALQHDRAPAAHPGPHRLSARATAQLAATTAQPGAGVTGIDAHLDEPISLTELAAIAGVETSWFAKLFYRSAGLPPYRYVLHRRINHAQHALQAGVPPAAVAMRCGFVDQAHLTRHFRRIVGVPPAAWAARAR